MPKAQKVKSPASNLTGMDKYREKHHSMWASKEFVTLLRHLANFNGVKAPDFIDEHLLPTLKAKYREMLRIEQERLDADSK